MKKRTQTIHLFDKTNETTVDLLVEQEPPFKSVTLTVDPSVKYQPVVGLAVCTIRRSGVVIILFLHHN